MTEEFWADYKKKRDKMDTNIIRKNVIQYIHTIFKYRSEKEYVRKLSKISIQMNYMPFVGPIIIIGDIIELHQSYPLMN